ncbi:molybdopterin oxidoreductase [Nakamurella antarctica]|uniref:Molybdopterin oxidoreductase n=2 Tax=Nakamurella antarctica TaxID=1902245 RepID=A0A3G9A0Q8_9ACTN|nr:molybdopterin oxidoreductase [Nakamurella antarctica]
MTHWGSYTATVTGNRITAITGHRDDPDPSELLGNIASTVTHRSRVTKPSFRRGWLENGPGPADRRGSEEFVELEWDEALDLLAAEIDRVRTDHGNKAIYAGSYGWASAGRFHHAQSQLHRFLKQAGGYVAGVNSYSTGCSEVIFPHLLGNTFELYRKHTHWQQLADNTDLIVAFGGIPTKNMAVVPGGITVHNARPGIAEVVAAGTRIVAVTPIKPDLKGAESADSQVEWWPIVPATDTAMMLALAHTLIVENLVDEGFIATYTDGYDEFAHDVLGLSTGAPRTAEWAESITGFPADKIRELARNMAAGRTFITVGWSLQRSKYGEQPMWAALNLACLLGHIGLPGGGFGHGYGSMGDVGAGRGMTPLPAFPQGPNPIDDFIPVARVSDMLLNPGGEFEYNGEIRRYPDVKMVYWAGGNPFHHHQDLDRLERAFSAVDTVVVHEPYWTSSAKHADIVLPCTLSVEREDIGGSRQDSHVIAMHALLSPVGEARDDFAIFTDLADRLGFAQQFTEGLSPREWLEKMYSTWAVEVGGSQPTELPNFETFWQDGDVRVPGADSARDHVMFGQFRADPVAHRLPTPSGLIQISSPVVASFGYDDCPGHPTWLEPEEWLGSPLAQKFPLHLIADQPAGRLHSQLDMGEISMAHKVSGRERMRMHPDNAKERGITDGDVVRVFNDKGECLAGVQVTETIRRDVVQLPTGAWFDPQILDGRRICAHGNPNVLTTDQGTSRLAQGCSGAHALVQVCLLGVALPQVQAFEPPVIVSRKRD